MMAHLQQQEGELRAVKEELDLAKKTIDRYTHLVTKLYDELDTLRSTICNDCKKKFVPGPVSPSASHSSPSTSTSTLWRLAFGSPADSQTNSGTQQSVPCVRNVEPTFVSLPASQPQPVGSIINTPIPNLDWSVERNHKVKQTLKIRLANTLKMKSVVNRVKFSRDGKNLAVGLHTGEIYLYDMKKFSKKILTTVEYPPKDKPHTFAMQFSPDDKYIATGGSDGRIRIWNIGEKRVFAEFKGHRKEIFAIDFSSDGRFFLSGSWDMSVRIWRMRDGSSKALLDLDMSIVDSVAFSPDGQYVAATDGVGMLMLWGTRTGQLLKRWRAMEPPNRLWTVVFTQDGKCLLSGGQNMILKCWNISSLMAKQLASRAVVVEGGKFQKHRAGIHSLSIFPGSRWVLSGSGDSTIPIWDMQTGAWQCVLKGHKKPATTADASPDGQHLASGSKDFLVRVWRYEQTE